jgi:hypothetical protein
MEDTVPAGVSKTVVPARQDGAMASSIPAAARDLVRAITEAVATASSGADPVAYDSATAELAAEPAAGRVLGDVLRSLLEDTHPDGFSSDDITLVIGRCYRAATAWLPPERVDVTVLLAVLASALGIHEPAVTYPAPEPPEDPLAAAPPTWADYAWHAPLVVADLLPFAPATLDTYMEAAFAEYAREAREESP